MKVKTAKAAILAQSRKPLVVDEIVLPSELGAGQVLVKVLYTTICGALSGRAGERSANWRKIPLRAGARGLHTGLTESVRGNARIPEDACPAALLGRGLGMLLRRIFGW